MIATRVAWDQGALGARVDHDPVVRCYRAFFALLDWTVIPERDSDRPGPGPVSVDDWWRVGRAGAGASDETERG